MKSDIQQKVRMQLLKNKKVWAKLCHAPLAMQILSSVELNTLQTQAFSTPKDKLLCSKTSK